MFITHLCFNYCHRLSLAHAPYLVLKLYWHFHDCSKHCPKCCDSILCVDVFLSYDVQCFLVHFCIVILAPKKQFRIYCGFQLFLSSHFLITWFSFTCSLLIYHYTINVSFGISPRPRTLSLSDIQLFEFAY